MILDSQVAWGVTTVVVTFGFTPGYIALRDRQRARRARQVREDERARERYHRMCDALARGDRSYLYDPQHTDLATDQVDQRFAARRAARSAERAAATTLRPRTGLVIAAPLRPPAVNSQDTRLNDGNAPGLGGSDLCPAAGSGSASCGPAGPPSTQATA